MGVDEAFVAAQRRGVRRGEILAQWREWTERRELDLRKLDLESVHVAADEHLLELLDDDEVAEAFRALPKWYS